MTPISLNYKPQTALASQDRLYSRYTTHEPRPARAHRTASFRVQLYGACPADGVHHVWIVSLGASLQEQHARANRKARLCRLSAARGARPAAGAVQLRESRCGIVMLDDEHGGRLGGERLRTMHFRQVNDAALSMRRALPVATNSWKLERTASRGAAAYGSQRAAIAMAPPSCSSVTVGQWRRAGGVAARTSWPSAAVRGAAGFARAGKWASCGG